MGLPVPAHMDGRVLMEAFRPDADLAPLEQSAAWESQIGPETGLTPEEDQILRQRLRDLGYVA
jgi:hypothetical protein